MVFYRSSSTIHQRMVSLLSAEHTPERCTISNLRDNDELSEWGKYMKFVFANDPKQDDYNPCPIQFDVLKVKLSDSVRCLRSSDSAD